MLYQLPQETAEIKKKKKNSNERKVLLILNETTVAYN